MSTLSKFKNTALSKEEMKQINGGVLVCKTTCQKSGGNYYTLVTTCADTVTGKVTKTYKAVSYCAV